MNASTRLLKALLARGDYLERLTRTQTRQLLGVLEAAHDEVLGKIAKTGGAWTREWLAEVAADIDSIYAAAVKKAYGAASSDLEALAANEAEFLEGELGKVVAGVSITAPASAALWASIAALPAASGSTLAQLFDALSINSRQAVVDAIRVGMAEGETVDQLTRRLRGSVVRRASWRVVNGKRTYIPGQYEGGVIEDITTRQARTLARTAVMHVGNQAREALYRENADIIKGYQRVETLDGDTCLVCGADDGHVYKPDESRPELPQHPNCLTGDALISSGSRVSAVSKRVYKGDMFVIRTASGKYISATPNHPVLTTRGFVPAQDIYLGDHLVCDAGIDRVALIGENKDYVEASFEQLFSSFLEASKVPAVLMPTTTEDFHGDGGYDEVAVVSSNGKLLDEADTPLGKSPGKIGFVARRGADATLEPGQRCRLKFGVGLFPATGGVMGGLGKPLAFFWACATHTLKLLFMAVACFYSSLIKFAYYIHSTRPKCFSNSANSNARTVYGKHFVEAGPNLGSSPDLEGNPRGGEPTSDGILGYTDLARNLLNGLSGPVSLDEVVEIRKDNFSGHVYNLQADGEYFIANGIITHNCRGVYVPVLKSFRELGLDVDEFPESTRASMDGQVAESETYADRLAKMDAETRRSVLGPGRAALYDRGVPLSAMVAGGKVIPLEEMTRVKKGAA